VGCGTERRRLSQYSSAVPKRGAARWHASRRQFCATRYLVAYIPVVNARRVVRRTPAVTFPKSSRGTAECGTGPDSSTTAARGRTSTEVGPFPRRPERRHLAAAVNCPMGYSGYSENTYFSFIFFGAMKLKSGKIRVLTHQT
jgi:hypothetical protein